jgi:ketosteroid isomerase-like protein
MAQAYPERFAHRYVEIINDGAFGELCMLFTEDATFFAPRRKEFHGREEINSFYVSHLAQVKPELTRISSYMEQGSECAFELEVMKHGETECTLSGMDHATVDESGLVIRFAVFPK